MGWDERDAGIAASFSEVYEVFYYIVVNSTYPVRAEKLSTATFPVSRFQYCSTYPSTFLNISFDSVSCSGTPTISLIFSAKCGFPSINYFTLDFSFPTRLESVVFLIPFLLVRNRILPLEDFSLSRLSFSTISL